MDELSWEIGTAFLKGILFEVSTAPKPGLVSPCSRGAHQDMNLLTFMASSGTIAPAFYLCAQAGLEHQGPITSLLPQLRKIGIVYERNLLKATNGVNTQRGILFAAGLTCGAAGYLAQSTSHLTAENVCLALAELTQGLVARELKSIKKTAGKKLTAGEQLYLTYQVTGIRGEVEAGFPCIREKGLPALQTALQTGFCLNDCLVHVLLALMTCVEDTTILWRKNSTVLQKVKSWSAEILEKGSFFTEKGRKEIAQMEQYFLQENISPGGSADLLAMTIGLYLLENKEFPVPYL